MSVTDAADRFVTLRGGLVVPAVAYLLLLDFERREIHVRRDGQSIVIGPSQLLTNQDRVAVRRWKWHLLMLLNYCGREHSDQHLFRDDSASVLEQRKAS